MASKGERARTYSDCSTMVIMRDGMKLDSNKLCRIPVGTIVTARKINTEWSQVQSNDKVGFIMNQFLVYGKE